MAINLNGTTGITTTGLTSNGIDDNATSTAITLDSSGNVGIGTSSPTTFSGYNTVHHKNTSGDAIYLIESDGGIIGQTFVNDASGVVTTGSRSNHPWRVTTNEVEHMRIDTSGAVTMPSQPAFSAQVSSKITNMTAGGSTNTTIPFGTQIFDQNADYNTDGTFTAPVTGTYQLSFFLRLEDLDASSAIYALYIVTSNRTYTNIFDPDFGGQDMPYYHANLSVLADMDAGDTAKIQYYIQGGASQTDISVDSYFQGILLS